jgi:hypothetical protein
MAGAAALRQSDRRDARAELVRALALPLDAADARLARAYLAEASHGLASRPAGLSVSARVGAGYDGNVLQSSGGSDRAPVAAGRVESAATLGDLSVAWRARPEPGLALDVGYGVAATEYVAETAEDYGIQQHVLGAALEVTLASRLRIGTAAAAEATFTGRKSLRAVDAGPTFGGWIALDAADAATTRLDVEWGRRSAPNAEFSYLAGERLDLALGQQVRLGPLTLDASVRHRVERLGSLTATAPPASPGSCPGPCPSRWVIPYGSTSDTLSIAGRLQLGRVLLLALGGYGWRTWDADTLALAIGPEDGPGLLGASRRHDERAFAAVGATWQLARWLSIGGRWDLVVNTSNLARGRPGHALDYDDKNYRKQVAALECGVTW